MGYYIGQCRCRTFSTSQKVKVLLDVLLGFIFYPLNISRLSESFIFLLYMLCTLWNYWMNQSGYLWGTVLKTPVYYLCNNIPEKIFSDLHTRTNSVSPDSIPFDQLNYTVDGFFFLVLYQPGSIGLNLWLNLSNLQAYRIAWPFFLIWIFIFINIILSQWLHFYRLSQVCCWKEMEYKYNNKLGATYYWTSVLRSEGAKNNSWLITITIPICVIWLPSKWSDLECTPVIKPI